MNFVKDERSKYYNCIILTDTDEDGHETSITLSPKYKGVSIYGCDANGEENTRLTIEQLEYILAKTKEYHGID